MGGTKKTRTPKSDLEAPSSPTGQFFPTTQRHPRTNDCSIMIPDCDSSAQTSDTMAMSSNRSDAKQKTRTSKCAKQVTKPNGTDRPEEVVSEAKPSKADAKPKAKGGTTKRVKKVIAGGMDKTLSEGTPINSDPCPAPADD